MEEMKKKASEICDLKDTLVAAARDHLSCGIQGVNTHEMGAVTDMIKDLAEAEEKIYKACYYKTVVEAMKEEEEREELMAKMGMQSENGRMGYDHWRYSSGRFAPTGRGHRSGYVDPERIEGWMHDEAFGDDPWMKMGYSDGGRGGRGGNSSSSNSGNSSMGSNGRMGYMGSERGHRYDKYHQARMGYHESKDAPHKEHMDAAAREYVVDTAETIKEIWRDADPAMRKEIKNKFIALANEMN